jgi:hypothetical protein
VSEGGALNTPFACPPLTILEQAMLRELRAKEAARLAPDSTKARRSLPRKINALAMKWDTFPFAISRTFSE